MTTIHKPSWFSEDTVMVSTAPTCGLTKGGRILPEIDPTTGRRVETVDPETGATSTAVNDRLLADMDALARGHAGASETLRFIPAHEVSLRTAVPVYYDRRFEEHFKATLEREPVFRGFTYLSLGEMIERGFVTIRGGHGSPKQEQRVGDVPYIKVSDLRAGTVNINPTNRVPRQVAESQFWRGPQSGLQPFDLLCPERTSKNIGDFCVLMPGQEQMVVTKEVIIIRPGENADFDAFYLLWALTLQVVRDQWKRVIFMQTNREDVGRRYHEILVPVAPNEELSKQVSAPFRTYYKTMATAREDLGQYLRTSSLHHFFLTGAEKLALDEEDAAIIEGASEALQQEPEPASQKSK